MTTMNTRLVALAFGLVVAAIASPSLAQEISFARAAAIRHCATSVQKYPNYVWGDYEIQIYRECMAEHDQVE